MDSERLVDQILSGYIDPPLFYSLDACVRYFLKKYSIGDSIQLSTLPKWVQSMIPIELLNKLKIDIDTIITSKYKQSDLSYELSLINEKPST